MAWDGLTPAQAAAVLGEPSVRFRQRLHRAGRRLRLEADPELLDLVRRADPMLDPRVRADAGLDTESALRLLASELDRPPGPGPAPAPAPRRARRARRRRRPRLRIAVLLGAVAAAVFVVANLASTGDDSAVSPAQAQTILGHVRAALVFPPHAIYEEESVGTVTARDGATHTSGYHEWLSTSPPYDNRIIEFVNGKVQWEQAFVNGRLNLYDPATNTVYLAPRVAPHQVPDNPDWNSALSEVQYLLGQPNVTLNPHAVLDGAPAIELTFDHGRFSYWASPSNYQPLQSEDRQDSLPDGQGGAGITRYPIDRVLTGSAASPSLLSLQAQHPGAAVDHRSADYQAVLWRLFHERLHLAPSSTVVGVAPSADR